MEGRGQEPEGPSGSIDSSIELVHRAREGDRRALDDLFGRYVPPLRRFAHGRLPGWARGMVDTNDLVQDTLMRTMNAVQTFEPRGSGALLGYMRLLVPMKGLIEVENVRLSVLFRAELKISFLSRFFCKPTNSLIRSNTTTVSLME